LPKETVCLLAQRYVVGLHPIRRVLLNESYSTGGSLFSRSRPDTPQI
jgi:hypothetical protein